MFLLVFFLSLLILTGSRLFIFQNQQYYQYLKLYCYFSAARCVSAVETEALSVV
uniref:Uncharacterized protein n=1 Tax=Klebsiella pneumoniae TaxID=573 RepID=A0A8B0STP8_KLEPN|nr:hypothetical protein [Klebsiella pneumoniae]